MIRKKIITLVKYILLLFILSPLMGQIHFNEQKLQRNPVDYFISRQPEYKQLFHSVYQNVKPALNRLYNKYFSPIPVFPVEVVLVKDKQQWRRLFIKYPFSEWGAGLAIPGDNKIYILVENFTLDAIQETLIHEWLHHAVHQKFGQMQIPLWFEEGMVQKLSGRSLTIDDLRFLAGKILTDNLLTFRKIDSLTYFSGSKARLAYIQSLLAVGALEELTGIERADEKLLQKKPHASHSFYQHFITVVHISPDAFESRLLPHVKNKYKWFFIFNLENILFILIIVVLLGAYYHLRYRNKIILERWAEKEVTEKAEQPDHE